MTSLRLHLLPAILLTMCLSPLAAYAGDGFGVSGSVINADGEAEPYATIRIYAAGDSTKATALGTADDYGRFDIAVAAGAGDYRLHLQAVGQGNLERRFTLTESEPHTDLGALQLGATQLQLDEISVTAQRPLVTKSIDRIGYDVQADTDAATSPLSEMLKKVPMVSVDPDGTIKVKGSTNFKIYKNGRPNKSFSSNSKDIFAAIPASSIKRIEVITDPGAREDAEGATAILNIVTVDDVSFNGISGSVNVSYRSTNDLPTPNLWLMTQVNKVTVSGYGGGHFSHGKRQGISSSLIERTYTDTGNRLESTVDGKSAGDMGYWGFEGSWEPDTLNMVTFDTSGIVSGSHNHNSTATGMTDSDGRPIYSYTRLCDNLKLRYTSLDFGINYQRSTHRKGENITLSYQLSLEHNSGKSAMRYDDMVNVPFDYTAQYSDTKQDFTEHTAQLDWTRPFGESHTIDVGAKYIRRNNTAVSDNDYADWQTLHTDFTHTTDVAALYGDYRLRLGRWGARAGLRYEYSRLNARFNDGSQPDFGHSLNDVVPNVAASLNISDASTVRVSYGGRISRPGISMLNPTVSYSPTSTSSGNPNLESCYYHNVDLNYSLIRPRFNGEFSASYNLCDNNIDQYMFTRDDHTYQTYGNVSRVSRFDLSAYMSWSITDKTRWIFNGTVIFADIRNNPQDISRRRTLFNIWTRITQKLPWRLELAGSLWWSNGSLNSAYTWYDYHTWGRDVTFSLQRNFLKEDRLQVSAFISNPWGPTTQRMYGYTNGAGYNERLTSVYKYPTYFGIRVGLRFGSLKAQVKKTAAQINNDDRATTQNPGSK